MTFSKTQINIFTNSWIFPYLLKPVLNLNFHSVRQVAILKYVQLCDKTSVISFVYLFSWIALMFLCDKNSLCRPDWSQTWYFASVWHESIAFVYKTDL